MEEQPNLVQDMIDERETNVSVDYMELLQEVKSGSFWIFVEGNDTTFFRTHVFRVFGRRPNGLPCNGKVGVLKLRSLIEHRRQLLPGFWKDIVTLYFVDKDHDDFCQHFPPIPDDVFVTDVYSAENYLVCGEVLANLLEDALIFKDVESPAHIWAVAAQYTSLKERFEQALTEFHAQLLPLSQWLIIYKRHHKGKRTPRDIKPRVNVKLTSTEFEIDVQYPPLKDLDEKFGLDTSTRGQEMHALGDLHGVNPKTYTRGKYEAEFFLQFFRACHSHLRPYLHSGELGLRENLLSTKHFLVTISEKLLTTPPVLVEYLSARYRALQGVA